MIDHSPKKIQTITVLVALALAVWFLWPQLNVIILTTLLAYIFYPLFKKLKSKKSNGVLAAVVTLFLSFMVVVVPLTIIIIASVSQLSQFVASVSSFSLAGNVPSGIDQVVDGIKDLSGIIPGVQNAVTDEGIISFIRNSTTIAARFMLDLTIGIVSSMPQVVISLLVYAFLFIELLLRGPRYVKFIKQASPFDRQLTDRYLDRVGLMAGAMVKGQLVIAMILALIAVLLLTLLGYGSYSFLFFILFTILNFIPLGSGVILIPLALYSMLTGQFWLGLIVIIAYLASGNLDPILRTKLIPKSIKQSVAVTMIATFCGIAYFGMLGVVYGPIIMIIISTSLQMYVERKQESD